MVFFYEKAHTPKNQVKIVYSDTTQTLQMGFEGSAFHLQITDEPTVPTVVPPQLGL